MKKVVFGLFAVLLLAGVTVTHVHAQPP